MIKGFRAGLGMLLLSAGSLAMAQDRPAQTTVETVVGYAKPADYPKTNAAAYARHFNAAREIAGSDLWVFFDTLCIQDQLYTQRIRNVQYNGIIPAQKVFDNLYYLGQMAVSAWAINTPDGIILIDALNNTDEARNIIVPALRAVGLDPARIKYVIITHSHGDHYGGAQYLRDTYGAKLVASAADWEVMERPASGPFANNPRFSPPPHRGAGDMTVSDGQTLSLGGADVHFGLTPAHTPGTLSLWFKATDNGRPHTVGMYGGIGMPRTVENKQLQLGSMAHWIDVTKKAGVDAQIGNHPLHFDGPARLEVLKYREAGQTNPFVIGNAAYERFMGMMTECVKMSLARDGVAAP
jgi:metallo-beta-lactamase class B